MDRLSPQKRRVLIMALAGVAVLAGIFFVTKVVMPHSSPSNPIAAVTSAPGKARAVAAASDAATARLNVGSSTTSTPSSPTTTATTPAVAAKTPQSSTTAPSGPQPNATRNPFLP
jgi:hypothetical protein